MYRPEEQDLDHTGIPKGFPKEFETQPSYGNVGCAKGALPLTGGRCGHLICQRIDSFQCNLSKEGHFGAFHAAGIASRQHAFLL